MGTGITGKEYPLSKIFSKKFDYYIPEYQRPYAWTQEETETLFDDLFEFYNEKREGNYFLGSIVLSKEDEKPYSEVIDGQQRLTTLTILLSTLTQCVPEQDQNHCMKYIEEPGDTVEEIEPSPKLHLRPKDQEFFHTYIQEGNISQLLMKDPAQLKTEAQKHIRENCELLSNKITNAFHNDANNAFNFFKFLMNQCYIVAVWTPNRQSAFRVFSVMNSRGLDLMPTDIIKADIISQIPENERETYTNKWEYLEDQTTRLGFNDVFTHTRMIFAKSKAKQNILADFKEAVLAKYSPKEFIDNILEPYSNAYTIIVNKKYESTTKSEIINQYLFWLSRIDNADWMPSAIKFFAEQNDADYILWFIQKLERLSSYLFITSKDVNHRIERYKKILEEMEEKPDHSIEDPLVSIELKNEEKKEFINALDGDIYLLTGKRRNYVILRLNEFVGDGATKFDFNPNTLTIEHVLPQTVSPGSQWESLWPTDAQRKIWLNRISNLVPLTRRKNSAAQNYDFKTKKEKYFKGANGTTTYPLTTQILCEEEWTPIIVEKRQSELLAKFTECWDLNYTVPTPADIDSEDNTFFINNKRGANAEGYPTEGGFVVKKGSSLSSETVALFNDYYPKAYRLREELEQSIITNHIFQEDYEFTSISLATSVILGRNANGKTEWVDKSGFSFEESINTDRLSSEEFNIDDERTYNNLKTGSLAYELIKHILESEKISDEEVTRLKTKEYTKQLFSRTDYPVLADNREDHRGGSNVIRYRKKPVIFKGKNVYITTQWFADNRKDIIAWYRKHI